MSRKQREIKPLLNQPTNTELMLMYVAFRKERKRVERLYKKEKRQ